MNHEIACYEIILSAKNLQNERQNVFIIIENNLHLHLLRSKIQ